MNHLSYLSSDVAGHGTPIIVVSNTSPLTNLAAIGQFDLLRKPYARLQIAEGVWDELNAKGRRWPGSGPRDEALG